MRQRLVILLSAGMLISVAFLPDVCLAQSSEKDRIDTIRHLSDGKADDQALKYYASLIRDADKNLLTGLRRLHDYRKKKNDPAESGLYTMSGAHLKNWLYLLKKGADIRSISRIYEEHLPKIVEGFRTELFPADFVDKLTIRPAAYSLNSAKKGSAPRSSAWLRAYIKQQLERRQHLSHNNEKVFYRQDIQAINKVDDVNILLLLKKYVDFFNEPETVKWLTSLFPRERGRNIERGGVIFANGSTLRPVEILPGPDLASTDFYEVNPIYVYLDILGAFHTHPLPAKHESDNCAGPSFMDIDYLRDSLGITGNPYIIEIVITQTPDNMYNVDAYFCDTAINKETGNTESTYEVTVIDLGLFRSQE